MHLFTLPAELLELILSYIHNTGDLARFAQTSKRGRAITEHRLYRTIDIQSFEQAGIFLRAVKQKHRARHVRSFTLDVFDSHVRITDWAVQRLDDYNVIKEAYVRGRDFGVRFLSLFPRIETVRLHAQLWLPAAVRAELDKIATHGILSNLRACSLAFRAQEGRGDDTHWNLDPWAKLLTHSPLTELELIRGMADEEAAYSIADQAPAQPTNLKSLRLLDCHLSHPWLLSYLSTPKSLETLDIVVTSAKATQQTRHLFMDECPCSAPLKRSLTSLTYLSLRPTSYIPRDRLVYRFEEFTALTELTISASELFGSLHLLNSGMDWETWTYHLPANLEILGLHLYTVDVRGGYSGVSRLLWRVLRVVLLGKKRYPLLRRLVLYKMEDEHYIQQGLVELAAEMGVEVRMVLRGGVEREWKRLGVEMLMG